MPRKNRWISGWFQDILCLVLSVGLGLAASMASPYSSWFERWSYDLSFFLRPAPSTLDQVALVTLDPPAGGDPGSPADASPNRARVVDLLRKLFSRGAAAVVLDIPLDAASATNAADQSLSSVLRATRGRVVLSGRLEPNPSADGILIVRKPAPSFLIASPWGLVGRPEAPAGILRELVATNEFPSLAWTAAQVATKGPTNRTLVRWLSYYGPNPPLQTFAEAAVISGSGLAANGFSNKVVFIAPAATTTPSSQLATPYTFWTGKRVSEVELQATAYLNLARGDWLRRLSPQGEQGLLAGTGVTLGLVFMGRRLRVWALLVLASVAAALLFVFALLSAFHTWVPWLIVVLVQLPAAAIWARVCKALEPAEESDGPLHEMRRSPLNDPTPAGAAIARRPASPANPPAPSISDHTLVKNIGRGAYGEVWLARDIIGSYHAVKIVSARTFAHATPYDREFKGIQQFAPIARSHPGLLQIQHVGRNEQAGYFYYIMELADDASDSDQFDPERYVPKTLTSEIARRGHLTVRDCVRLGVQLAAALQHLHERHLVHRDIKPSNIIYVNGVPKMADIGLVTGIATTAQEVSKLGTEGYMAPEGPGAPAADIYSLGKVLYEAGIGRDRWQFPELPTTLGARPDEAALRRLHEIILTACETDPKDRFPSAAEMRAALEELQSGK